MNNENQSSIWSKILKIVITVLTAVATTFGLQACNWMSDVWCMKEMSNAILTSSQYQNYRRIDLIVIHCSATRATQRYTVDDCRRDHRARGFADIGYHYYITRDGVVHAGRALYQVGAHATGYNEHSIGVCYEGGLDIRGRPCDTRTPEQKETLQKLLERLKEDYPDARVVGHRDLPGVKKDCPCYDAYVHAHA